MDLPNELLESIFLKLSRQDIQRNVALVCQRFLQIALSKLQELNFFKIQTEHPWTKSLSAA